jgi:hypothetical protein
MTPGSDAHASAVLRRRPRARIQQGPFATRPWTALPQSLPDGGLVRLAGVGKVLHSADLGVTQVTVVLASPSRAVRYGMASSRSAQARSRDVSFAMLASRVASSARRAAAGYALDERRDLTVLNKTYELLQRSAETVRRGEAGSSEAEAESYAFMRWTRDALPSPRAKVSDDDDSGIDHETIACALEQLCNSLKLVLDQEADRNKRHQAAETLNDIFSRLSSRVLSGLGHAGDSLGGVRSGNRH